MEHRPRPARPARAGPDDGRGDAGYELSPEFDAPCAARAKRRVGNALGLRNFGVNLVTLPPGTASSQRHWHSHQDEFVYVVEGEATLITDAGEQTLGPGMVAGFPAGKADGHHPRQPVDADVLYLEVGGPPADRRRRLSDVDMLLRGGRFVRRDGAPY